MSDQMYAPVYNVGQVMDLGWKRMKAIKKAGTYAVYPVSGLEGVLGPHLPGEYVSILAPTHHGKSVFTRIWAAQQARWLKEQGFEDTIVLYVVAEDGAEGIHARMLQTSGIEVPSRYQMMVEGVVINPQDQARLSASLSQDLDHLKIMTVSASRDSLPYFSPDSIMRALDDIRSGKLFGDRRLDVSMIVLDYLSALRDPGQSASDWTQVADSNEAAFALAQQGDVLVVAAAQAKQPDAATGVKISHSGGSFMMPGISDFYGGGAIPQRHVTVIGQVIPKNIIQPGEIFRVRNTEMTCRQNLLLQYVAKDRPNADGSSVNRVFPIIMENGWRSMRLATQEELLSYDD